MLSILLYFQQKRKTKLRNCIVKIVAPKKIFFVSFFWYHVYRTWFSLCKKMIFFFISNNKHPVCYHLFSSAKLREKNRFLLKSMWFVCHFQKRYSFWSFNSLSFPIFQTIFVIWVSTARNTRPIISLLNEMQVRMIDQRLKVFKF